VVGGGARGTLAAMKKTLGDMARSLGLMAVVVAALLFLGGRYLIAPGAADRMPPADYSGVVQAFGDDTGTVLTPRGLPSTWRANAARLLHPASGAEQMHVGWVTTDSRFAGLDEASGADALVLSQVLGAAGSAVRGSTTIADTGWQVRRSDRGETAYTRLAGKTLVIVTGNATDAELRLLAQSLH
jgi:hypothetical protein